MTERMTFEEFHEHCGSPIGMFGLSLKGASLPNSYAELVDFFGEKFKMDGPPFSTYALAKWVLDRKQERENGVPTCAGIDIEAVSSAVLIADLPNPDEYVQKLPDCGEAIYLPPLDIVRALIDKDNHTS